MKKKRKQFHVHVRCLENETGNYYLHHFISLVIVKQSCCFLCCCRWCYFWTAASHLCTESGVILKSFFCPCWALKTPVDWEKLQVKVYFVGGHQSSVSEMLSILWPNIVSRSLFVPILHVSFSLLTISDKILNLTITSCIFPRHFAILIA